MTVAAADWTEALGVGIPLIIVFGIFIVWPLTGRRHARARAGDLTQQLTTVAETQAKILDELHAIRARIDGVEETLASVE